MYYRHHNLSNNYNNQARRIFNNKIELTQRENNLMATIVPIRKEQHQNLKVAVERSLSHANNQHIVPINASEYSQASNSFPIVIIKETQSGEYRSVVMLGLEEGENLYAEGDKWKSTYIPQSISMVPFVLGLDPEKENTLTTCINMDSPYVGEDKEQALFDKDGNDSEFFKTIKESMGRIYNNEITTDKFIKELQANELLTELELNVASSEGDKKRLIGLYGIDTKKLEELPDDKVLDFHKRGLFIPIHAMMSSLGQVHRLAQLRNLSDSKNKVSAIRLIPLKSNEAETA